MAQPVKVLFSKPNNLSSIASSHMVRELTLISCSLTSTHVL